MMVGRGVTWKGWCEMLGAIMVWGVRSGGSLGCYMVTV